MSSSTPIFLLLIIFSTFINISSSLINYPDRYIKSLTNPQSPNTTTEYTQVTKPSPPNPINPNCSALVLQNDFDNTLGSPPFSTLYSPPANCSGPWNKIYLEYSVSCDGKQYDRISGVWLNGVEILRTSTAQPNPSGLSLWKVRKDVTKYSSLFNQTNSTLSVMLENLVTQEFTGIYHVNISLLYYQDQDVINVQPVEPIQVQPLKLSRKLGGSSDNTVNTYNAGETTADLIFPVSGSGVGGGNWFWIQNELDIHSKTIQIPQNTKKAVLEIYVSSHGNDEFWYSNPPNSYIEQNNLTTQRGNRAFRQVFATVDGVTVGSATPFPVIYTGGINPLFWEPVVAIGAFNFPTYDFDLTPFLGFLLDGKNHSFGLGVTDCISFWLVSANLHLWLDHGSDIVQAQSVSYLTPPIEFKIKSKSDGLDGKFKIKGKRELEYSGWVNSSTGNFTTRITEKFKFKNKIKIKNYGQENQVKQKIKVKTEVIVENEFGEEISKSSISRKYPLKIKISTLPGADKDTFLSIANVSNSLEETYTSRSSSNGGVEISVENSQDSGGWMVVKDHSVILGTGSTTQTYSYQDQNGHYSRVVAAANGKILQDNSTLTSASSSSSA